jgi:hypothetical protein
LLDRYERHDQIPLSVILGELEDSADTRELLYLQDRLELYPVVNIRYHRRPLIPHYEHDMRITLDTRITAGGDNLATYNDTQEKSIIAPELGVFEVKTNQAIPMWLQSILCRYALPQTRYSKYCLGVDAVYGRGGKQWFASSPEARDRSDNTTSKISRTLDNSENVCADDAGGNERSHCGC